MCGIDDRGMAVFEMKVCHNSETKYWTFSFASDFTKLGFMGQLGVLITNMKSKLGSQPPFLN
jgi:hypothetical protein